MTEQTVQARIDDPNASHHLIRCRLSPKLDNCDAARRSLLVEAGWYGDSRHERHPVEVFNYIVDQVETPLIATVGTVVAAFLRF